MTPLVVLWSVLVSLFLFAVAVIRERHQKRQVKKYSMYKGDTYLGEVDEIYVNGQPMKPDTAYYYAFGQEVRKDVEQD